MSAFFPWSNITKQLLMIFQCLLFVTETALQNSRWRCSNVPIKTVTHFFAEATFKTVADDILMSPFCRWNDITKQLLMIFLCPHFVAEPYCKTGTPEIQMSPFCCWRYRFFFEIQQQKVDFFNKKYQRHFWGCDEKKFQRQMCDCQNSLRTYELHYAPLIKIPK